MAEKCIPFLPTAHLGQFEVGEERRAVHTRVHTPANGPPAYWGRPSDEKKDEDITFEVPRAAELKGIACTFPDFFVMTRLAIDGEELDCLPYGHPIGGKVELTIKNITQAATGDAITTACRVVLAIIVT